MTTPPTKAPQKVRVRRILEDGKEHPSCEIEKRANVKRVAARIWDLEQDGDTIVHGRMKVHGTWWASYQLVTEDQGSLF